MNPNVTASQLSSELQQVQGINAIAQIIENWLYERNLYVERLIGVPVGSHEHGTRRLELPEEQ